MFNAVHMSLLGGYGHINSCGGNGIRVIGAGDGCLLRGFMTTKRKRIRKWMFRNESWFGYVWIGSQFLMPIIVVGIGILFMEKLPFWLQFGYVVLYAILWVSLLEWLGSGDWI